LGPELIAAQIVLNVHVPVSTVLELSGVPGSLDRYGPVSAEHIRLLRPTALRRVLVDGLTGRPLALDDRPTPVGPDPQALREQVQQMLTPTVVVDTDEPQHDPSARLARLIDLRDVRCCGPGCSSTGCERDHLEPWPTGPTNADNLGLLSPRCHHAKHHGWLLVRHPDGSVTWTSPLGRLYHRPSPHDPPPRVDLFQQPPPLRPPPKPTPIRWATAKQPNPPSGEANSTPSGQDDDDPDEPPPF
jgi:hypothetical protein